MENQHELNNERSLAIISEMIANTRNNVSQDGFYFLLWGFILVTCCIVQFIMIYLMKMPEESNYVWMIMPVVGVPASIWYAKKSNAKKKVITFADNYYKFIWLGYGISLIFTFIISGYYKQTPTFFIMILTGFAVFASGIILKFKPLIYGAIVFWLASLSALISPDDAMILLLFGLSITLGYIVPGFLLRKQYKMNQGNV